MMTPNVTLTLVDGVKIIVPDSLELITSYVLQEQEDWFEDEIKFIRHLLQPGQKVIDIGANYGIYSLVMGRLVGPTGQVWAFEPATSTAEVFEASVATNAFGQIYVERSALSNKEGTAQLSLNENSELNELVRDGQTSIHSETVKLMTLDGCAEHFAWLDIEFIKMDAEGEESNILLGGWSFLRRESPLIQYEIKAGDSLHLDLVQEFASLGYQTYRLVPGLDALVPFHADANVDPYLLNLFCCKPDCAARLSERGLLIAVDSESPLKQQSMLEPSRLLQKYGWRQNIVYLPYGKLLAKLWDNPNYNTERETIEEALALFAMCRDAALPIADRFAALESSFNRLVDLCNQNPAFLRLATLARVARAYGERAVAVDALGKLIDMVFKYKQVNFSEPFLMPGEIEETKAPHASDDLGNWIVAGILKEFERSSSFSSYYVGTASMQLLQIISDSGYADDEMLRRLKLIEKRFGAQR